MNKVSIDRVDAVIKPNTEVIEVREEHTEQINKPKSDYTPQKIDAMTNRTTEWNVQKDAVDHTVRNAKRKTETGNQNGKGKEEDKDMDRYQKEEESRSAYSCRESPRTKIRTG